MAENPGQGGVCVVGSINIDHTVTADRFPQPGETILGEGIALGLGGKGANQAIAAALAGAPTSMLAAVGDDDDGTMAVDRLSARGVDVTRVRQDADRPTGTAWITVTPTDNTIIVIAGANGGWGPDLADQLPVTAVTVAQLEIPVEAVTAAAQRCDGTFILNAAPAMEVPAPLLAACDVLVVNEHELAVVSGFAAHHDDPAGVEQAHLSLLAAGVGAVVTTLGERGAVITDAGGTHHYPAVPAQSVVDTTGAGDAFTGTLAARLAVGAPLSEAVVWGMTAGSLAVRRSGAQESYATAEQLAGAVLAHGAR